MVNGSVLFSRFLNNAILFYLNFNYERESVMMDKLSILVACVLLCGCGQECYTSQLQLAAKYEGCQDLGTTFSPRLNQPVKTFVCSTSSGDKFADFIIRDGKLCRTYQQDN